MQVYSFPSISNNNAKVLVLGTMPGMESLRLNQYYGHNRNAFWKLVFTIFDAPFSTDYEIRKEVILKNNIAVWDVLSACIRKGSLDSAIEQEVPNDFDAFLATHPNIEHIFFNGQKAAHYFKKYVSVPEKYKLYTLPSTSPAHAGMPFEKKLNEWQIIKQIATAKNPQISPSIQNMKSIAIKNAGLVLLNNYLDILLERLHLTANKQFTSVENQTNAVHYLQYVITGIPNTEEALLPLNKVLCGLPLTQTIPTGITISEENKQLIEGLLQVVISHWTSVGQTTIDGFRENWLIRDGQLSELEDRWELIIEKRPFDVLLHNSPFSFSIIKYPWMGKPLHVTWPY